MRKYPSHNHVLYCPGRLRCVLLEAACPVLDVKQKALQRRSVRFVMTLREELGLPLKLKSHRRRNDAFGIPDHLCELDFSKF